jgi:lysophospholipase L1-like esterase
MVARSLSVLLLASGLLAATPAAPLRFDFGSARSVPGRTAVPADLVFTSEKNHGFEPGSLPSAGGPGDVASGTAPFSFTVRLPREGNYLVTVTVGHPAAPAVTTIRAELRRLMAERIPTAAGETRRVSFVVNTRTPRIAATGGIAAGTVRLKAPRETTQEAAAWDDALTLEFSGQHPAVRSVEVAPIDVPTLFVLGDSTVCDQSREPYASWGQMLTRWFQPTLAVANHGESGETYRDALGRRRVDKILSLLRPGDWVLLQFGHNDQKQIATGTGGPFTTYLDEIRRTVTAIRARSGAPVLVTPMERRSFDAEGRVRPSLADYAEATRRAARELGVPCLDLHAVSLAFHAALGPDRSALAFASPGGKVDNTHHNAYGAYQLARAIVQAIRDQDLPLARCISPDFPGFDPARPDDPATFSLPASRESTTVRPLGDEPPRPGPGE